MVRKYKGNITVKAAHATSTSVLSSTSILSSWGELQAMVALETSVHTVRISGNSRKPKEKTREMLHCYIVALFPMLQWVDDAF